MRANDWKVESLIRAAQDGQPRSGRCQQHQAEPAQRRPQHALRQAREGQALVRQRSDPGQRARRLLGPLQQADPPGRQRVLQLLPHRSLHGRDERGPTTPNPRRHDAFQRLHPRQHLAPVRPGRGRGRPLHQAGRPIQARSGDDPDAAWNTEIDTIHPDAGFQWWIDALPGLLNEEGNPASGAATTPSASTRSTRHALLFRAREAAGPTHRHLPYGRSGNNLQNHNRQAV